MAIIEIKCDDGHDFATHVRTGTGGIGLGIGRFDAKSKEWRWQDFSIDEVRLIVGVLNMAIDVARSESDELEARNGD